MASHRVRVSYNEMIASLPLLETEEQLNMLEVLSSMIKRAVRSKERTHSLLELEGLGADTWKNISADDYVNAERDSWS